MNEEEQKYFKGLIGFTFDSDDIKYIEKIVDKKDKEIERLKEENNNLKFTPKTRFKDIIELRDENERLKSIIKEVREYIEENTKEGPIKDKRYFYSPEQANDILEILEKENK